MDCDMAVPQRDSLACVVRTLEVVRCWLDLAVGGVVDDDQTRRR
jgi:hypothetical protein